MALVSRPRERTEPFANRGSLPPAMVRTNLWQSRKHTEASNAKFLLELAGRDEGRVQMLAGKCRRYAADGAKEESRGEDQHRFGIAFFKRRERRGDGASLSRLQQLLLGCPL